jgi:hypothetical protein
LPPRYYVPQVNLPPAQPLEQVATGYPEARDEAPTWIASAALRDEMLGEWPVAAPLPEPPVSEPPVSLPPVSEPEAWAVEELPAVAPEPDVEALPEREEFEPEPELEEVSDTPAAETLPEQPPDIEVELARSVHGVARYSLDPLAEPAPRKRFGRGGTVEVPAVEVPSRPEGLRPLPGRSNRQD